MDCWLKEICYRVVVVCGTFVALIVGVVVAIAVHIIEAVGEVGVWSGGLCAVASNQECSDDNADKAGGDKTVGQSRIDTAVALGKCHRLRHRCYALHHGVGDIGCLLGLQLAYGLKLLLKPDVGGLCLVVGRYDCVIIFCRFFFARNIKDSTFERDICITSAMSLYEKSLKVYSTSAVRCSCFKWPMAS